MTDERTSITLCSLDGPICEAPPDFLIDDGVCSSEVAGRRGVVLPSQDEARARHWLDANAACVYLGTVALRDGELVGRLCADYGGERIGVYLPLRRMEVNWSLETVSNADFRVVTPSVCEAAWEILGVDQARTGTVAGWWLQEMFARGAASAILRVDIGDDTDLNLCATLTEAHGRRLWFAPWRAADNDFGAWTRWGKVAQIAAAPADLAGDAGLLALCATTAPDPAVAAA